jgi:hypothetical protein
VQHSTSTGKASFLGKLGTDRILLKNSGSQPKAYSGKTTHPH